MDSDLELWLKAAHRSAYIDIVGYDNGTGNIMVFIIDGCSVHYAHTWSKSGVSIC